MPDIRGLAKELGNPAGAVPDSCTPPSSILVNFAGPAERAHRQGHRGCIGAEAWTGGAAAIEKGRYRCQRTVVSRCWQTVDATPSPSNAPSVGRSVSAAAQETTGHEARHGAGAINLSERLQAASGQRAADGRGSTWIKVDRSPPEREAPHGTTGHPRSADDGTGASRERASKALFERMGPGSTTPAWTTSNRTLPGPGGTGARRRGRSMYRSTARERAASAVPRRR